MGTSATTPVTFRGRLVASVDNDMGRSMRRVISHTPFTRPANASSVTAAVPRIRESHALSAQIANIGRRERVMAHGNGLATDILLHAFNRKNDL
jgi:hypothetical protein